MPPVTHVSAFCAPFQETCSPWKPNQSFPFPRMDAKCYASVCLPHAEEYEYYPILLTMIGLEQWIMRLAGHDAARSPSPGVNHKRNEGVDWSIQNRDRSRHAACPRHRIYHRGVHAAIIIHSGLAQHRPIRWIATALNSAP